MNRPMNVSSALMDTTMGRAVLNAMLPLIWILEQGNVLIAQKDLIGNKLFNNVQNVLISLPSTLRKKFASRFNAQVDKFSISYLANANALNLNPTGTDKNVFHVVKVSSLTKI